MPIDDSTRGLLDAIDALLEAIHRLEMLAERLRVRALVGPPLTAAEAAQAERELAVSREGVRVLEGKVALFRQGLRPM